MGGGKGCRVRIVWGGGVGGVRKEAVVEEGAFEEKVDEAVEEVPDVEDAKLDGCAGGQQADGKEVCGDEEGEGGEEGEDGYGVYDGERRGGGGHFLEETFHGPSKREEVLSRYR